MTRVLTSNDSGHLLIVKGDFSLRWDRFARGPLLRPSGARDAADTSPELDVSRLVLEAWRNGLSEPDLGPDDDLLAFGADSLNSIDVLAGIGERLGVSLPSDLFFQVQTPRLLAASILQRVADVPRPVSQMTARHWGAAGPMIWCLHPISGTADCFAPLARLLDGHQVRAVNGQSLTDVTDDDSFTQRAIQYRDLLAAQGPAPTAIVGWSYGGILAFETAHAVYAASGQSPPVVIIDICAPTVRGRRSISEVNDVEILLAIASHRARESGQPALDLHRSSIGGVDLPHIIDRLRSNCLVPPNFSPDLAKRLASGYRRRMRAIEDYQPAPYPGQVIVLQAREPEFGDTGILEGVLPMPPRDPSWGWEALAQGGCSWQTVDGHHSTLLQPPSLAAVARCVLAAAGAMA